MFLQLWKHGNRHIFFYGKIRQYPLRLPVFSAKAHSFFDGLGWISPEIGFVHPKNLSFPCLLRSEKQFGKLCSSRSEKTGKSQDFSFSDGKVYSGKAHGKLGILNGQQCLRIGKAFFILSFSLFPFLSYHKRYELILIYILHCKTSHRFSVSENGQTVADFIHFIQFMTDK